MIDKEIYGDKLQEIGFRAVTHVSSNGKRVVWYKNILEKDYGEITRTIMVDLENYSVTHRIGPEYQIQSTEPTLFKNIKEMFAAISFEISRDDNLFLKRK